MTEKRPYDTESEAGCRGAAVDVVAGEVNMSQLSQNRTYAVSLSSLSALNLKYKRKVRHSEKLFPGSRMRLCSLIGDQT